MTPSRRELSPSRPGRVRRQPAATPNCWPSPWCAICWAGAARPGSSPRGPAAPATSPRRPGPSPACSDAELLAIAMVRHLLGRRSEAGFLAEVARDWGHLFPVLPHQSEANRRTRWLWGAFEQVRVVLAARLPEDDCQQIDTSAIPVRHPSRVRGPDGWTGPNGLAARFGRDAAHAEWSCGFRLAIKTG